MRRVLRLLFVKESQSWPRSSGHDVHAYYLMKSLIARGHQVSLASVHAPTPQALEGLALEAVHQLGECTSLAPEVPSRLRLSLLQRKFRDYFGVSEQVRGHLHRLVQVQCYDAVIVVARHLLPLLVGLPTPPRGPLRIWYPADDPLLHHLSRIRLGDRSTWGELKLAALNALYVQAYRGSFDRAWVVSPRDRQSLRSQVSPVPIDLIPNGVDSEYYTPATVATMPGSAVFWGRLDFGPNFDAMAWFLKWVWPQVVAQVPQARFDIFGFNPTDEMRKLAGKAGVSVLANLPDLREEVRRRQVVVLPFVSGSGIKNKLLEAAAMAMPIVGSPETLSGLRGRPPIRVARTPQQWVEHLRRFWNDGPARHQWGEAARRWVLKYHTWDSAAARAESVINHHMS